LRRKEGVEAMLFCAMRTKTYIDEQPSRIPTAIIVSIPTHALGSLQFGRDWLSDGAEL
jgi:hypothetical protein